MIILGIIIKLIGLITLLLRPQLNDCHQFEKNTNGDLIKTVSKSPEWLLVFNWEAAKIKFPSTMIISGADGGGPPIEAMIGAARPNN